MAEHKDSAGGLALVTGASSGIGRELARILSGEGYRLIISSDEDTELAAVASELGGGDRITTVVADLREPDGVEAIWDAVEAAGEPLAVLCANAGVGFSGAFVDTDIEDDIDTIAVNVASQVHLLKLASQHMVDNGAGRILITGSIAGTLPGAYQSVYNASKAFLNSMGTSLREELKHSGVSVTVLMPGATETKFFERGGFQDTPIGESKKADPAKVAKDGIDALLDGDDHIISGWMNKLTVAVANVAPNAMTEKLSRGQSLPNELKERDADSFRQVDAAE